MDIDFSTLDDATFAKLGKSWYQDNLRRHQLLSLEDIEGVEASVFHTFCDCIDDCECTGGVCNACCPGCAANKSCDKCQGGGLVAQLDCVKCKGEKFIFPLNGLTGAEHDRVYDECMKKQTKLREVYCIESMYLDSWDMDTALDNLQLVIKKLGGVMHIDQFCGLKVYVSYPKFLLTDAPVT